MKKSVSSEDRKRFEDFYRSLKCRKNLFFLYCTQNLLHYVLANIEFHREKAELVLITGGLTEAEKKYVEENVGVPFCCLGEGYTDFYIWDLIIETSEENFGWLDIDCFVNSKKVFEDISCIPEDTAIQAVWERKYRFYQYDGVLTSTYLQFINIHAAKEMWDKYPEMSMIPVVCGDEVGNIAFEGYRILDERERAHLSPIYPQIDENKVGLDTTHYFQMMAVLEGYRIGLVRELKNNEYSEDIIHLGGSHLMGRFKLGVNKHRFFDKFNMRYSFSLLCRYVDCLPEQYKDLKKLYENNMRENKMNTELSDLKTKISDFIELNGIILPVTY